MIRAVADNDMVPSIGIGRPAVTPRGGASPSLCQRRGGFMAKVARRCEHCAGEFMVYESVLARKGCGRFCSRECHFAWRRSDENKTAQRRHVSSGGYIVLMLHGHPRAARGTGFIMEHRVVVEREIGRYLRGDEIVHHRDGNKQNNDISNLELTTRSSHSRAHSRERWDQESRRDGVDPVTQKRCRRCLAVRARSDFYSWVGRNGSTRLKSICKPCAIEASAENTKIRKARNGND